MRILEPCCFSKQLSEWLPQSGAATLHLLTYGDVTLPNLLPYLVRRCSAGTSSVSLTASLYDINSDVSSAINALRTTMFSGADYRQIPLLSEFRAIVRDASNCNIDSFSALAESSDNFIRCVTMKSDSRKYTLLGDLVQFTVPGPHLYEISTDPEMFDAIHLFLESQLRTHRIK